MKLGLALLCLLVFCDYGDVGLCPESESDYIFLPHLDLSHGDTLSVPLELKGVVPTRLSLCLNNAMNLLRFHCLFILKDWFNISVNSLPAFMNTLNSKTDML